MAITASCGAQTWPSGAISDPEVGLPGPPPGTLFISAGGAMLRSDVWSEKRARMSLGLGLGHGLALSVGTSSRDLSGYGAFQRGVEDTRLGLSFWPTAARRLKLGVNGYFLIPTGYREQMSYSVPPGDSMGVMPAFSLGQTASEIYGGASWSLGSSAEVNGFGGYFVTSDNAQQAFRWGLGAWLAPLGPRYALELGYSQSLVRAGEFPNTEAFSAALALRLPYGFSIVPGMWADLKDDPVYGGSVALRFSAPVHGRSAAMQGEVPGSILLPRLSGAVLVPPPLADFPLADSDELWRSIRQEMSPVFDDVMVLPSLDVPGLPYRDNARAEQENSIRAIAAAHPDAEWLLISRVEREDVSRQSGTTIPLVVSQPQWVAQCRLCVELVSLKQTRAPIRQVIEGRAVKRESPSLLMIAAPESDVLSISEGRNLTFQAYRQAGREIAREVSRAQ